MIKSKKHNKEKAKYKKILDSIRENTSIICTILSVVCAGLSSYAAYSANKIAERQTYIQEQTAKPIINFNGQEEEIIDSLKIINNGGKISDIKLKFIIPYLKVQIKDDINTCIQVPILTDSHLYMYRNYGTKTGIIASIDQTDLSRKLMSDLEHGVKNQVELLDFAYNIKVGKITLEYSLGIEYTDMFENTVSEYYNCSIGYKREDLKEIDELLTTSSGITKLSEKSSILKNNEQIMKLSKKTGWSREGDFTNDSMKGLVYDDEHKLEDHSLTIVIENIVKDNCFRITEDSCNISDY